MKKRIIALILALQTLIMFVSCEKNQEQETSIQWSESESLEDNTSLSEMSDQFEEIVVKENVDVLKYLQLIAEIDPDYNYTEYYLDDNAFFRTPVIAQQCDNIDTITFSDVYNSILKNSALESPKNEREVFLKDSIFMALTNCFSDQKNFGDDFCKLKDVKFELQSTCERDNLTKCIWGEYYAKSEKIIIYYDSIIEWYENDYLSLKEKYTFLEYLTKTVEHEINHARQHICDCRVKKGQTDSAIFDLMLIEASAESMTYNKNINQEHSREYNTYDYTYSEERGLQSLFLMMGMFKEDFSIEKYYEAIYDRDMQKLYDLYGINTDIEKVDFYNLIYSMSTLTNRTLLYDDLIAAGCGGKELTKAVGNVYKIQIFKATINDFIKKINKGNMTLEECIVLYNFVKEQVIKDEHIYYTLESRVIYLYDEEFLNDIGGIEDLFYRYLCEYYNVTIEDIKSLTKSENVVSCIQNLIFYFEKQNVDNVQNIIAQYPIITEIIFSQNITYINSQNFDSAREFGYIEEKYTR